MKNKVKKLYQSIKEVYKLADEIDTYALDQDSEFWDEAGTAAGNITEAIDTLQELFDDYKVGG